MIRVNDNFQELPSVYLFTQISRILKQYRETEGAIPLIRMDIGDVPGPIADCVTRAMHKAVEELSNKPSFKGYGPEQGYAFLRDIICQKDYQERGISIDPSEIFISDGAKCDIGNFGELLSKDCKVAVMDPSYPAYIDDNVIDGRAGRFEDGIYTGITYLKCNEKNNFSPEIPAEKIDIIYLCSPNNPTGTVLNASELRDWVKYAKKYQSLIIYDSAYEAYIRGKDLPRSIFEIEGAKEVAIEIRSFSKTGGFTGIRCGYTVVPHELVGYYSDGNPITLNALWNRRQTTKFNGASYISQRAAEALYTEEGRKAISDMTNGYLKNACVLKELLKRNNWEVTGGENSPYVWAKNPYGFSSNEIFEVLLKECGISVTPGTGFGLAGEGYIRLSGFNSSDNTNEAVERLEKWFKTKKTH